VPVLAALALSIMHRTIAGNAPSPSSLQELTRD